MGTPRTGEITGSEAMSEADVSRMLEREAERFEEEKDGTTSRRRVTPRPAIDPSQVYSVRIPVSRLEELRALAEHEGKRPSTMIRDWVLERLDSELRNREAGSPAVSISMMKSYSAGYGGVGASPESYRAAERLLRNEIDRICGRTTHPSGKRRRRRTLTAG